MFILLTLHTTLGGLIMFTNAKHTGQKIPAIRVGPYWSLVESRLLYFTESLYFGSMFREKSSGIMDEE